MPAVVNRDPLELSLANFTVKGRESNLASPVAGGVVESGTLKGGETKVTNW
jgi:alkaline phosphatase D